MIFEDNGQMYVFIPLNLGMVSLPSFLNGLVKSISYEYDFLPPPAKKRGRYRYKSASAVLDTQFGHQVYYRLSVSGKSLKTMHELHDKIRSNQIESVESWE